MIKRLQRQLAERDDEGIAMVFVILAMVVVSMFVVGGLAYAVESQNGARHDQDYNAALAAAQAGVEDYISHLNRNDNYGRLNPFNDCANAAMKGPKAPTPNTCGWSAATPATWQRVTDATIVGNPEFHYDVDGSQLDAQGTINVRSTGRANGVVRSLEVAVSRGGSTQFLYYTDHEDADPANQFVYPGGMPANCGAYWWGTSADYPSQPARNGNNGGCTEITFVGGDVLDGAVHTNDTPLYTPVGATYPEFKQGVETADPACKLAVKTDATTWKNCDRFRSSANYDGIAPRYADPLLLPDNSGAFGGFPGCQYTGPTRIIFNTDGTMNVWSSQSTTTPACGGTAPWNTKVAVPLDQVIYVKAQSSGIHRCKSGEIDGTLPLGTFANDNTVSSYTYDDGMLLSEQNCGEGNVYVQGTLKGRVTLAAQNSVVVTGDLRLAGTLNGPDLLGLVAANSVEVYHPILSTYVCSQKKNGQCIGTYVDQGDNSEVAGWPVRTGASATDIEIDASIQTLGHSFLVQNYDKGTPQGKLTVRGSIAQKWRGIVGRGNPPATGYLKDYHYDLRLKYSAPPYFPQFVKAVWAARHSGEVPAQY